MCCECACVYAIIYYFFAPAKTSSVCERCECARAPAGRDKICYRIRSLRRSRPVAKRTRYAAPDFSFYAFLASPPERRRNRVILYCVDNIYCRTDVKSRILLVGITVCVSVHGALSHNIVVVSVSIGTDFGRISPAI